MKIGNKIQFKNILKYFILTYSFSLGTIIEGSMTAKGRARASFSSTGDFAVMEIIVAIFMISLNLLVIKQNVSRLLDHKSTIKIISREKFMHSVLFCTASSDIV